jgi:hypothetical protein
MPKYYVHQIHKGECIPDLEGADFPDVAALREEVIIAARQIMANRLMKGEVLDHSRFEVSDEMGKLVLTLPFGDAIPKSKEGA